MLLGKVAPLKTFCFWDSLLSQKLWPRLLHEFHGKLLKGMITWAIRENIRNPMPDYSSSPLETLNNIWDINPNDKGSNGNQSAWPSNGDRESSYCLKWCPWSPLSEQEDPKSFKAESYPLSGMAETDKALHSLFDLIEKIYVRTWYNKFSANQCVPRKLRWDQFCLVKHQSVFQKWKKNNSMILAILYVLWRENFPVVVKKWIGKKWFLKKLGKSLQRTARYGNQPWPDSKSANQILFQSFQQFRIVLLNLKLDWMNGQFWIISLKKRSKKLENPQKKFQPLERMKSN